LTGYPKSADNSLWDSFEPFEVNMSGLSTMIMLLIVWSSITLVLIVLLIYRSTLTMHEDDQLFLGAGETQLQEEQQELLKKMAKLQPFVRVCGAASAMLLVVMAGMWLWDAYQHF
jgi:hypothetical protein